MPDPPPKLLFRHRHRLHGSRQFSAVLNARCRKNAGPISVCALPNHLPHCRLGLTVSRRVGNAVTRHRLKRLLREAFRLSQHDWPTGYDLVVIVHPHPSLTLAEYQKLLFGAIRSCHLEWERRRRRSEGTGVRDQGSDD